MPILTLLIYLILLCVVVWAAYALIAAFAIPEPLRTVLLVVVVIVVVLIVLQALGGGGLPTLRWR